MNKVLLEKFAKLAIKAGVNLQKDQLLLLNAPIECAEFVRIIVKEAYEAGACYVLINWNDDEINKLFYTYSTDDVLAEVPEFIVQRYKYIVDNGGAALSITSPNPGLLKDIDPKKLQISQIAASKKISFYREHMMTNKTQWSIVAYPNTVWAKKVFPDLTVEEAQEKLLLAILEASHVRIDNDPVAEWNEHMINMKKHNEMLNDYNFEFLKFKNSLGTDLTIQLVENHIWGGGGETASNGVYFAPNIPTEEAFTMPHKYGVNGTVVSTKPLNYQGKLIENFKLTFKDGEVIDFEAEKGHDVLKSMLEVDEGSKRLGEVALISFDSPISNTNILFYNTLFDENASCHLALGNAYTMNIKGGNDEGTTLEQLVSQGFNKSMIHVDFMFGSADMSIIGVKHNKDEIEIFKNGNFVF